MLPVAQSILRNSHGLAPLVDGSPTVSAEVTPTVAVEATATPLPAVPTPAPTSAPAPWAPDQWLHATGWSADFHAPFLVLFLFVAVAAVVAYFYFFQRRFKDHKLKARLAERVSMILTAFAAVGLLFLLFALGKLPLLSAPLWLILSMVAFIAFAVYAVYYYATVYPVALARHNREQDKARYIPRPKTKGPAQTPPMKKKHKQKRK